MTEIAPEIIIVHIIKVLNMPEFRDVLVRYILPITLYIPLIVFFITVTPEISSKVIFPIIIYGKNVDLDTLSGFTITAYCPGPCCNGQWSGLTSSGIRMDDYKKKGISIVAVDPSVIPLGSIILYGTREFVAADVGRLIRGNHIDILVDDHESTLIFGKRQGQIIHVNRSAR